MKKYVSILALLSVTLSFSSASAAEGPQVFSEQRKNNERGITGNYVMDELVVKFKGDDAPFRVIKVPANDVLTHVKVFTKLQNVVFAEPNYQLSAYWSPNDPFYAFQWHFDNPVYGGIEAEDAWSDLGAPGTPGQGTVVAVVDTGVAYEDYGRGRNRYFQAPDLADTCFVAGYDFVDNDSHANDANSHGTHVASTIAESTNNALGASGLAFEACIMPVRVLDKNGLGTTADVADGIRYASDNGADVINLSLGGPSPSSVLEDAVNYAHANGSVVIAASGNENTYVGYPAAYANAIAVGATRYDEARAPYSNYGSALDIVAPGGDVSVDQNGDGYGDGVLQQTFNPNTRNTSDFGYWFFEGTSMASPHVSAVAAMLISNGNATTPEHVRVALEETADDLGAVGWDSFYGHGLVNAAAALAWATTTPPLPDPDPDPDPDPEPTEVVMYVGDINLSYESRGSRCRVSADVSLVDENGSSVQSALVSATWSGAYSASQSDSTDSAGLASFRTSWVRGCGTFTLTVDDVVKDGYNYDVTQNIETSDTIVVASRR